MGQALGVGKEGRKQAEGREIKYGQALHTQRTWQGLARNRRWASAERSGAVLLGDVWRLSLSQPYIPSLGVKSKNPSCPDFLLLLEQITTNLVA